MFLCRSSGCPVASILPVDFLNPVPLEAKLGFLWVFCACAAAAACVSPLDFLRFSGVADPMDFLCLRQSPFCALACFHRCAGAIATIVRTSASVYGDRWQSNVR